MISKSNEIEERAVERVAELMCLAARTAPKARGIDNLIIMTAKAGVKDRLVDEMRHIAKVSGTQFFERDARCLEKAQLVVLFGQRVKQVGVAPCGYCGYNNCQDSAKNEGLCAISIGDLGIAMGAAVSVAADHRVDNRVMFSVGKAALNLDMFEEDVKIAYGVPLSATGKNPFFDR